MNSHTRALMYHDAHQHVQPHSSLTFNLIRWNATLNCKSTFWWSALLTKKKKNILPYVFYPLKDISAHATHNTQITACDFCSLPKETAEDSLCKVLNALRFSCKHNTWNETKASIRVKGHGQGDELQQRQDALEINIFISFVSSELCCPLSSIFPCPLAFIYFSLPSREDVLIAVSFLPLVIRPFACLFV